MNCVKIKYSKKRNQRKAQVPLRSRMQPDGLLCFLLEYAQLLLHAQLTYVSLK